MDKNQLSVETHEDGLVHLRNFMTCPILHRFHLDGLIDGSIYANGINDYLKGRLSYLLKSYFQSNEKESNFATWGKITSYAVTRIAPNVNRETWGRYRSILIKSINIGLEKELGPAEVVRSWLIEIQSTNAPQKKEIKERGLRTIKASKLTTNELYLLRLNAKNPIEHFSLDWLEMSLCTGIRPVEIKSAKIYYLDEGLFLACTSVIKSNRTKDLVDKGVINDHRLIPLANVSLHSLKMIESTLSKFELYVNKFNSYQFLFTKCRTSLRELSQRTLGYKISISVGRKQFAANLKSLDISPDEIANQMGHSDPTRARRSYGAKRNGHAKKAVKIEESN